MEIFWPLVLNSDLDLIVDEKDIKLRQITEEELVLFFGIKKTSLSSNFWRSSYELSGKGMFPAGEGGNHIFSNLDIIFSSNYVFSLSNSASVKLVNSTLKLLFPSVTGISLGFTKDEKTIKYYSPNPYFNGRVFPATGHVYRIDDQNKDDFINLYNELKLLVADSRLSLILDLFLDAVSGENIKNEVRFLNLMSILEILFLEEGSQGELTFKLSLRIAKLLKSQKPDLNATDIFNDFSDRKNGLYNIRSKVVHNGKSSKLTPERLNDLINYVRESILIYVKDQSVFSKEKLKSVVLD